MTDQPQPDLRELRARLDEAETLLLAARQRAVADRLAILDLRDQLRERETAYEQLSRLVETNPGPAATND